MFDRQTYSPQMNDLIDRALSEDLGVGDTTTSALVDAKLKGTAVVHTREDLIVAGLGVFARVFERIDSGISVTSSYKDGDRAKVGTTIVSLKGPIATILQGERVALNFLQRLCGIATLTHSFVDAVPEGCSTIIVDTRKTTPGLRLLERLAVRCGGGHNHRPSLDGGILIKDNHIAACGSIAEAIARARAAQGPALRIEVEVTNLDEVEEALVSKAEVIMLDNMSLEIVRRAVKMIGNHALIEASGGISQDKVRKLAEAGVDFISVGALTHSARAIDLSLKLSQSTC